MFPGSKLLAAILRSTSSEKRAVRLYLRRLPAHLFKDYGHLGPFTPQQVESSIRRYRIGKPRHVPLAVALFCDPAELKKLNLHAELDARRRIGAAYLGSADFNYSGLTSYSGSYGGDSGFAGHAHHGGDGGHSGGGHH